MSGIGARIRQTYQRVSSFFTREIWEHRLDELSAKKARRYSAARILYCTLRGLIVGDSLHVRAAALTYFTVLSLVPFLAFAFAVLKGFGAYDTLIEKSVRPYVLNLLGGNEALRTAFEKILDFVEDTGVTSLGFIGLLTLLYAATRLLRNIEGALNEVWSIDTGRGPLQQLRDYITIIFVTPLCLMAGAALTTAGQALNVLRTAGETLGIGGLLDSLISFLGPIVVLLLGLLVLYKVMPYTNVRFMSALLGAAIGAVLWYLVLLAHVRFQIGVARFNALYSSFGAIPIFLAWLHISWLVVLVGAQIAATHQNSRSLAQRARMVGADQATKETLAVACTLRVANAFVRGDAPPNVAQLSKELSAPEPLLKKVLDPLVEAGLVLKVASAEAPTFSLARPAAAIRVKDAVDALRRSGPATNEADDEHAVLSRLATKLWCELDQAAGASQGNLTLHEVIEQERLQSET